MGLLIDYIVIGRMTRMMLGDFLTDHDVIVLDRVFLPIILTLLLYHVHYNLVRESD